jgi:hypothetical protein
MIEYLQSIAGTLSIRIGGILTIADYEELMGAVERSIESYATTHMFIEIVDFAGVDPQCLAAHLPRAAALLGKVDRFGRIAVVADQKWIRIATRIESALLPGIGYETYTTSERAQALDWVEGRRETPHDPSIRMIETDNPDVLAFELDGRIHADEIEAMADRFTPVLDSGKPVALLGRIHRFEGIELGAVFNLDFIDMKLRGLHAIGRYALVGGPDWLRTWLAIVAPLVRMEVRHFAADEEEAAWQWIGAHPRTEQTAIPAEPALAH